MEASGSGMPAASLFSCDFAGCTASYRRKEHLNRHKARHLQTQGIECPVCNRSFGRNDTLRRHMRQSHPTAEQTPPLRQACVNCRNSKSRCEGGPPCTRCRDLQIQCPVGSIPRTETVHPVAVLRRSNSSSSFTLTNFTPIGRLSTARHSTLVVNFLYLSSRWLRLGCGLPACRRHESSD
ncbi:hypothetical protein BDV12DRAFT_175473 [Aspergillus spectabilis]